MTHKYGYGLAAVCRSFPFPFLRTDAPGSRHRLKDLIHFSIV
jgi:hypothetical protein